MSDSADLVLRRLAADVLDPVLCGGPFSRGDGGSPDDAEMVGEWSSPWPEPECAVQLRWCAQSSEVARLLPGMWRQLRQHDPDGDGCIDVTVDLDVLGRLVAADVETVPLADLLAGVGQAEAAAAAAELPGLAAEVAVPALGDLLEQLLAAAATDGPSGVQPLNTPAE